MSYPGRTVTADQFAGLDTLTTHFYDIDTSDFDSDYAHLDPATHPASGRGPFLEDVKTSENTSPDGQPNHDVGQDGGQVHVDVHFLPRQEAGKWPHEDPSQTSTDWTLRNQMAPLNGLQLIVSTSAAPAAPRTGRAPQPLTLTRRTSS